MHPRELSLLMRLLEQTLDSLSLIVERLSGAPYGLELYSSMAVLSELSEIVKTLLHDSAQARELPQELVDLIIAQVATSEYDTVSHGLRVPINKEITKVKALSACSMVCSAWRASAQRHMFGRIELNSLRKMKRFLDASQGSTVLSDYLSTLDLAFEDLGETFEDADETIVANEQDDKLVTETLRRLPNITKVSLYNISSAEVSELSSMSVLSLLGHVLTSACVTELTTLKYWANLPTFASAVALPGSSTLEHLDIRDPCDYDVEGGTLPIYTSLVSLRLALARSLDSRNRHFSTLATSHASTLRILSLTLAIDELNDDRTAYLDNWMQVVAALTGLLCLRLESDDVLVNLRSVFSNLPPHLVYLHVIKTRDVELEEPIPEHCSFSDALRNALSSDVVPTSLRKIHLKERIFFEMKNEAADARVGFDVDDEAIAACEKRGIKLLLGEKVEWHWEELVKMYGGD